MEDTLSLSVRAITDGLKSKTKIFETVFKSLDFVKMREILKVPEFISFLHEFELKVVLKLYQNILLFRACISN